MSEWGGLIELFVVLGFAVAWGSLELYTRRLDRRRATEAEREATGRPANDA